VGYGSNEGRGTSQVFIHFIGIPTCHCFNQMTVDYIDWNILQQPPMEGRSGFYPLPHKEGPCHLIVNIDIA